MARAIVLKLAARYHGRECVTAGHDFLVEIVVLQRIWSGVAGGLALGDVLVAQLLHIVELAGEQREGAAVGVGGSSDGGEPEVRCGLIPEGGKPALADRVLIANGIGERTVPLAKGGHGLNARFQKGLGKSGFGA